MTLLLTWFPIILGVGVGGRLLGRTRGFGLGILCALFWIVLVQASAGAEVWFHPWTVAGLIAGAVTIVSMGGWSGEIALEPRSNRAASTEPTTAAAAAERRPLDQVSAILDQFDDWLEDHRKDNNPWPKFDEFVRTVLYNCCGATHVRPYRLMADSEELVPLSEADPFSEENPLSARQGIIGHVVTTGRTYLDNDGTHGELVSRLAEESSETIAWCFAVRQGATRLGVVVVGHLEVAPDLQRQFLRTVERLVVRLWCSLLEVHRSRSAVLDDPVSGLLTREAFLAVAEQSLAESYAQGEPVAAVVVTLERLRELNDSGRWEVADELVRMVGQALRRKVRMDDRLGRFDGSRFVLLLRRVDSELASLIVAQIMSQLEKICSEESRWQASIVVRCGVAGSGTEDPDLRGLLSRALMQCHRARTADIPIASDLKPPPVAGAVSS